MIELYELIILVLLASFLYWNVREVNRQWVIVFACSLYIVYEDYVSFVILTSLTICTYYLLKRRSGSKILIYISLLIPILLFIIFKWRVTFTAGVFNATLPLGMSFYLFRLIHFSIEVLKKNVTDFSFKDYVGYLFFLPVILIGPIIRYSDWQKEFKKCRWNPEIVSNGFERIVYGLFKIVVLGNFLISNKLNNYINYIETHEVWLSNYLDCFKYAANSYMLFAGYSDVAIGCGMLFGIRLVENFKFPFLAQSINEFWNRWHISLSTWCRDYVFMPVVSYTRIYWLSILTSMLVLGLWHEFSLRYISWAFFHVIGILIWFLYSKYRRDKFLNNPLYKLLSWFVTINFVIISFAFLKEATLEKSFNILKILLGISQ